MSILKSTQTGGCTSITIDELKRRGYFLYTGVLSADKSKEYWHRENASVVNGFHAITHTFVRGKEIFYTWIDRQQFDIPDVLSLDYLERYWDDKRIAIRNIFMDKLIKHIRDVNTKEYPVR